MRYCLLILMCMFAISLGCMSGGYENRAETVDTAPVNGKLTLKGKPLEYYQILFFPEGGSRVGAAVTDAEGGFVIGTNDGADGAPLGNCKIAVNFVGPPPKEAGGNERIIDNPADLPKPKFKIPAKYNDPEKSGLSQVVTKKGLKDIAIDINDK